MIGCLLAAIAIVPQAAKPNVPVIDPTPWLAALGGRDNIREAGAASSRLWLDLANPAALDAPALQKLGVRLVARPSAHAAHLLVADAAPIAAALQAA